MHAYIIIYYSARYKSEQTQTFKRADLENMYSTVSPRPLFWIATASLSSSVGAETCYHIQHTPQCGLLLASTRHLKIRTQIGTQIPYYIKSAHGYR